MNARSKENLLRKDKAVFLKKLIVPLRVGGAHANVMWIKYRLGNYFPLIAV